MKVFVSPYEAGRWAPASVAAIGAFDAMHLGHQKVLRSAVRRAGSLRTRSLVVTFDPEPRQCLRPGVYKPLLTLERKLALIAEAGVDAAVLLPFNKKLACQAPESFAREILSKALRVVDVIVGADFCFGKDREGRVETLEALGRELGFLVHPIGLLGAGGEKIDTARIRRLLGQGKRREAEALIGRPL